MKFAKALPLIAILITPALSHADGKAAYVKHCASCHHPERYGLSGPPLIPEYFGSKKPREIASIISEGLKATNMPAFKGTLSESEIAELVAFVTSPAESPKWGTEEMLSTWELSMYGDEEKKARYDMTNFFMIVEGGAGRVHFMDGDSFKLLDSIKAGAIHGGPKYDKDLRYAYIASRDGWVTKYDLINLHEAGKIRAGISSRNIAVSSTGRHLAVATLLPESLVIIDSLTMKPVKVFSGRGSFGSVYSLKERGEFIVALRDKPELLVVDDKTFEVKSHALGAPLTDFFIEPGEKYLVGTSREGSQISVFDIAKGTVVKTIKTEARMPHLASAAIWSDGVKTYAAFPHIGKPLVTVMELYTWEPVKEIKIKGPGFFARTLDGLPEIWVDTGTDTIQLIDKKTLEVKREITPQKDKKAMHIEFTREGKYALISVWEDEGAVNVYDAETLELKKSMPFRKPVGKYNATNKKF